MTRLLWYFVLEEDRVQPALGAGILAASVMMLLWGGEVRGGAGSPYLAFVTVGRFLKRAYPCFIFCMKSFLARNPYNNCVYTCLAFCHVVFVCFFNDLSVEMSQVVNGKLHF